MEQIFPPSKMLKSRPPTEGSLTEISWQSRVRVVLVETQDNLNIGSCARALSNLGFSRLYLVAPKNYDIRTAGKTACWARPLLLEAPVCATLEEALVGVQEVVAFSGRTCDSRHGQYTLPEWTTLYHQHGHPEVALVFGSEDDGLRKEHLEHARYVVRIPSFYKNPIFNLAQSVLLACYELSRPLVGGLTVASTNDEAKWEEYPILDEIVESVCLQTGYYRDGTPHPTPATVKNLLRRTRATSQEIRILIGLFSKINRTLKRQIGDTPGE